MKFCMYFFGCLILFFSFISAEQGTPLQVKSTGLYDTSWTNPSDGTSPILTAWKLKVTLDDDYVFETNHKNFSEPTNPRTLVHPHDTLQILQEAYCDNNPTCSWFRIFNITTGQEFDLMGVARKPKPAIEPNTPIVQGLQKKQLSDHKWSLTFFINNLNSLLKTEMTEIYTTIEVDSEKYHGYYEGMPLSFIEEQNDETDELFGRTRKSLVFFNPNLNVEVTFKSRWMGGTNTFVIDNVQVKKQVRTIFSVTYIVQGPWSVSIYLNDGAVFVIHGNVPSVEGGPNGYINVVYPSAIDNIFRIGNTVELIEMPTPVSVYSQYQTSYQLKNMNTGGVYQSTGEIRYLNGYLSNP